MDEECWHRRETVVVSPESLLDVNTAGSIAPNRTIGDLRWKHLLESFDVYPTTAPTSAEGAVHFVRSALGELPPEEAWKCQQLLRKKKPWDHSAK